MNEILNWLVLSAAGLLGLAVAVATWEYLRRQTLVEAHPRAQGLPGLGLVVDVPLDTLDSSEPTAAEPATSQVLMSQTLTRASSQTRQARDGSPWLDTQPRVSLGLVEPLLEAAPLLSLDLRHEARQLTAPEAAARPAAHHLPLPQPTAQQHSEPAERAASR